MNVVREIQKLNEKELELGLSGRGGSYHDDYKDSAWIFVGNLDFEVCAAGRLPVRDGRLMSLSLL